MTLKTKFLLLTAALTAVFVAIMVAYSVYSARQGMLARAKDRAEYFVDFISARSAAQLEKGNIAGLENTLQDLKHFEHIAYLRVSDSKGKVLSRLARPGIRIADRPPDADIFRSSDNIYDISRDIIGNGKSYGTIQFGLSTERIRESLEVLMWRGLMAGLSFLVLISGVIWLLVYRLGRQLDTLRVLAGQMNSETLPAELRLDPRTETGGIAAAMRETHALLQAEKKRRIEAETQKDDFFAMTVHDLKQPLTALKASLDLLLPEDERNNFTKDQLRGLAAIAGSSLKMLNSMVVDVLNMAKLNSRDFIPEKTRIPLVPFIRECADTNSIAVKAAGKKWSVALPENAGNAWIYGDRDLIKRVVGNLVLNAIQYTPEDGAIKLGLRFISRDKAAIYVSDEGEGIPDIFREEIFKKYQGLGKSSKNIGLGLAFCRMVADKHAGAMDVKSEMGKGTEMSLVMPVSSGEAVKPDNAGGEGPDAGKK